VKKLIPILLVLAVAGGAGLYAYLNRAGQQDGEGLTLYGNIDLRGQCRL